ncbi:MAG: alpha/beta hydrolase-fold protein [Bacteroidota bacterium]
MRLIFTLIFICSLHFSNAQIVLQLNNLPGNTPAGATYSIVCEQNDWNATDSLFQFKKIKNKWQLALPPLKDTFYFKVTRASNNSIEVDSNYESIQNRVVYPYQKKSLVTIDVANWNDLQKEHSANKNVEMLSDSFYASMLGYARKIYVYLPNDYYQQPDKRYPVVYAFQGQNLFDNYTAQYKEWRMDETLRIFQKQGDNGCIVIGIEELPKYTNKEINPFYKGVFANDTGTALQFGLFINFQLKPYVDSVYRTKRNDYYNAIVGAGKFASMALFIGLNNHFGFSKVGLFSPVFENRDSIFGFVAKNKRFRPKRFYITYAYNDSLVNIKDCEELADYLQDSANYFDTEVNVVAKMTGSHNEVFWSKQFRPAYEWLFDGYNPNKANLTKFDQRPGKSELIFASIYPNPAQGNVTVETDALNFKILTDDGLMVKEINNPPTLHKYGKYTVTYQERKQYLIDLAGMLPGNYYVVFTGKESTKSISRILVVR